ncbi:copper resistance protein [Pandoraea thiooxydans]|uniref:Copper resistance protein n=1 Tax=Pandoraea thiooxydans TaxID=445709 RepID=A0A0G3EWE1_9BURK|nr:copper resistance protein CopC [Pandoraea thiooxydans]AKJ69046.1 copper resistance protein [Pandoraea thiooxydans]APR96596.1 copper resistance protein [Pandoraea thiooxydans]
MNQLNYRWYRCLAPLAAFIATVAFTSSAFAHAMPQKEVPAPTTTVAAPQQVSITFDDPLEPAFSTLTLTNAKGQRVTKNKSQVAADNHKLMTLVLPALSPGRYTAHWAAVALDGHRTHGEYSFRVK